MCGFCLKMTPYVCIQIQRALTDVNFNFNFYCVHIMV